MLTIVVALLAMQGTEPAKAPDPASDKVCRTLVPTGSIMAKTVCRSARQWKRFDASSSDNAKRALDRRTAGLKFNLTGSGGYASGQ